MAVENEEIFLRIHSSPEGRPRPRGCARSAFGVQTLSQKQSLPMTSFSASASRDQLEKMFISSAHIAVENKGRTAPLGVYQVPGAMGKQPEALKANAPQYSFSHLPQRLTLPPATQGPPPGRYDLPSSIGDQAESRRESPARTRFGRATREKAEKLYTSPGHLATQLGTTGVDPGRYDHLPAALGPQPSSLRRSAPSFTMGRPDRLRDEFDKLKRELPPPGSYETWKSIGKQSLSTSKTMPSYAFGSSTWGREEKRFLGLGHTRILQGTGSPSNYDHQQPQTISSFGRQVLSSRESPPRAGFGYGSRMILKTSDTPGPGHYD